MLYDFVRTGRNKRLDFPRVFKINKNIGGIL